MASKPSVPPPDALARRILALATASSVLLAASLLLPGLVTGEGNAAAAAALAFLLPFGVSALLAVYVLFIALGRFGALSLRHRVAGLLPAVFVSAVVAMVLGSVGG